MNPSNSFAAICDLHTKITVPRHAPNPAYQDGASDAASAALTSAQELQEPGSRMQLFLVDSRWTPVSVKDTYGRIRDIQVQVAVIGFWFFRMQHWKQSFIWLWCPQGMSDVQGERKDFSMYSWTPDRGIARQREDGWSWSRSAGTLLHLHVAFSRRILEDRGDSAATLRIHASETCFLRRCQQKTRQAVREAFGLVKVAWKKIPSCMADYGWIYYKWYINL